MTYFDVWKAAKEMRICNGGSAALLGGLPDCPDCFEKVYNMVKQDIDAEREDVARSRAGLGEEGTQPMTGFLGAAFSSAKHDWATPLDFWRSLDAEFGFTLDAAASEINAKCSRFFTEADDGLNQDWRGIVWCNPPYGRTIGKWVEKAYWSAQNGATVVMLIPSRTDTGWWNDWAMKATEIRYVRGRLRFGGAQAGAPFPSAVLVFRGVAASEAA